MFKTIILGYDDSDESKRALQRAAALAKAFEAKLVVASVAPVSSTTGGRSMGTDPVDSPADHLAELGAARSQLEADGLTADYVEAIGHPADSLLEVAQQRSADVIVVGSRHLSHMQRLFGQSVSDSVSHGAQCDVLLVH